MHKFTRVRTSSGDSNSATAGGPDGGPASARESAAISGGNNSSRNNNSHNTTSSGNNGIGPFGMTGLGMGFGLYRPRRPSYTLATQVCRQRSESYRHATRRDNGDLASELDVQDGEDFIDGVIKRSSRKASLVRSASDRRSGKKRDDDDDNDGEEGLPNVHNAVYDDDENDDVIVTSAAAAAVSRARTPEARVAVDVVVTSEDDENPATSVSILTEPSCSEHFPLEPTRLSENSSYKRNVPNHLPIQNSHHHVNKLNDKNGTLHPSVNGNGTSCGDRSPACKHHSPRTPHNDLAHTIPLPPEAISKKRKTLTRSLACGDAEVDGFGRDVTATPVVAVSITGPNSSTAITPDSNSNTNLGSETVVVGLLTPVNGRVAGQGAYSLPSKNDSFLQRHSNTLQHRHKLSGISKFSFIKNLIILCLGFIFVYSSFRAIQNLQSSIHGSHNLGVITMTLVHISMVFASLLAPIVINVFTAKWAMCGGVMCFLAWFSAHVHPTFWTLVPTSLLVGLGQAVLWNAESSYVLKLAFDSAAASRRGNLDQEMFRFHGIFLACFQSTHIWGNLISSLMLSWYKNDLLQAQASEATSYLGTPDYPGGGDDALAVDDTGGVSSVSSGSAHDSFGNPQPANGSELSYGSYNGMGDQEGGNIDYSGALPFRPFCGTLHRCTEGQDSLLPEIYPEIYSVSPMLWKLMTSYIVLGFISFGLVLIFLDRIGARADPDRTPKQIILQHLNQLFHHKTLRLLTPLLLFNGMQQGFIFSDYNRYFVTCALGVNYVGYCMITLGASNVLGTIFVAFFSHKIPREVVLGFGGILHIALIIGFLIWIPEQSPVLYFVLAAAWGLCDAVWQTQCNTLICLTCGDAPEVAFNNYRLVQSLGLAVTFGSEPMMCLPARMYLLLSLLVIAIMFYVLAEYRIRNVDNEDG